MAQDFFFKLFAREFLSSKEIRNLSLEDQGILIRLWCVCCLEGGLPEDPEDLSIATGIKFTFIQMFKHKFEHLFEQHFKQDETGRLFSPRMERERERIRQNHVVKSKAGKASGEARRRKKEQDLVDAQTNTCSDTSSNICMKSHSHIKEEEMPSREELVSVGTRTVREFTPGEHLEEPDGAKHSRSGHPDDEIPWEPSRG